MYAAMSSYMRTLVAVSAVLLIGACASTPQAPRERDAQAKQFLTHPASSTIYVYRSEFNHVEQDSVLYMNGRLIGNTLPGAYFRIDAVPGRQVLHGIGIDNGEIVLDTRPGRVYFVSLNVFAGHSRFEVINDQVGREQVAACCALYENWAPWQRPLLR
jgi:hypothetical protein